MSDVGEQCHEQYINCDGDLITLPPEAEFYVASNLKEFLCVPNDAGALVVLQYDNRHDSLYSVRISSHKMLRKNNGYRYTGELLKRGYCASNPERIGYFLNIPLEVTSCLTDAPRYYKNAIEKVRNYYRSSPKHANDDSRHEKPVHFHLLPDDRCFARLFPDQPRPLLQWDSVLLIADAKGGYTIDVVNFGITCDTVFNIRGTWSRGSDLSTLIKMYKLYCRPQLEVLVSTQITLQHSLARRYFGVRPRFLDFTLYPPPVPSSEAKVVRNVAKLDGWRVTGLGLTSNIRTRTVAIDYLCTGPVSNFDAKLLCDCVERACDSDNVPPPEEGCAKHTAICIDPRVNSLRSPAERRCLYRHSLRGILRNTHPRMWSVLKFQSDCLHDAYVEQVLPMLPLELPAYVLLWIFDNIHTYLHMTEIKKITLLIGLIASRRKVLAERERGDVKKQNTKSKV